MEHSLNNALCSECDAHWIDGQLYWSNGKEGCPHDLAGLVCNQMFKYKSGVVKCINPCVGSDSGQTWRHQTELNNDCLLYTSPSPRDGLLSRMPSSA